MDRVLHLGPFIFVEKESKGFKTTEVSRSVTSVWGEATLRRLFIFRLHSASISSLRKVVNV